MSNIAYLHLPGLFEFYKLYQKFLPIFFNHPEYFYDFIKIGSIYGSPNNAIFSGGRIEYSNVKDEDVLALMDEYKIPIRLTFSNSQLENKHLNASRCNEILKMFENDGNGIIIYSDLLLNYIKEKYPKYHFISSTTKVLLKEDELLKELNKDEFKYVVPDFRFSESPIS